jgi:Ser/Thr protein kinase RdoA (MazF antagonist)
MGKRAILLRENASNLWITIHMMNTDIMRQLVAEAELGAKAMETGKAAANLWEYDEGTLADFRYSANAIYTFLLNGLQRFMRLTWIGDRQRADLEAELDFLTYLAENKFPAVCPVDSLHGNRIEVINSAYAQFFAVTFTAARGNYMPPEKLSDTQIHTWGALLGRLHQLSMVYSPPLTHRRPIWQTLIATYGTWIPEPAVAVRRYFDEATAWLSILPVSHSHYGLIHWDFEPDNLSWSDGRIEVFDFDDAAYFWYAADIAFALDDVLDQPPERARYIIEHFIRGYQSVNKIQPAWIAKLPLFVRLMRVLKEVRTYHAYAGTHPELDPPWLAELRKRHQEESLACQHTFSQPFQAPLTPEEVEIWGQYIVVTDER